MKKIILCMLTAVFLLNGCKGDLPIYDLKANFDTTTINGRKYAIHKLSYNGQTFISEPEQLIKPSDYERFKSGKRIGQTQDGMQIFQVKNDDKRIVIKGFMFPDEFYKLSGNE